MRLVVLVATFVLSAGEGTNTTLKDDCQYYRKVEDPACGDVCLAAKIGICPRSIVVATGGLEAGKCADKGYSVDKGEQDQKAGPCGTLKIEKWAKSENLTVEGDCQYYRKIQDPTCGDLCLPAKIGICPRSIVVTTGGLEAGKCAEKGYSVDKGEQDQNAGPCGTLKIEKWAKSESRNLTVEDDCQYFRKIQDPTCGDLCLPTKIGICPRSIVVSTGGLEAGKCADKGYSIDKGEQDQKAGPCGTLKIEKWSKAEEIIV